MIEKQTAQDLFLKSLNEQYLLVQAKVTASRAEGKTIYPKAEDVLNAFNYLTSFNDVKVVILGQDPYHGPNQAHGLAFSVPKGIMPPPSLKNIFKEMQDDLGIPIPKYGYLEDWAKQGVLLLNRVLTVEAHKPRSHASLGWEEYTNGIIEYIDRYCHQVVFLLWGSDAKKAGKLITNPSHKVFSAAHPSPLSASRGFFGCKHFSKANNFLTSVGKKPINWSL
jgi:uracil-DNA glycosylase